jgi:pyruvate/2-oxoglutarate dehydrogenase complex dihydrolipoamide acyltransferase (E2) component
MNDLSRDDLLRPGDLLIVGRGDPPSEEPVSEEQATTEGAETNSEEAPAAAEESAAPEAESAPEPDAPAADQQSSSGTDVAVCLKAYDDVNGNGVQDAGDALRPAVAFTISDGQSVVSNYVTDGQSEPFCVTLPSAGSYRVARSVLPNEVLTTAGDRAVSLSEGSTLSLEFGSYLNEETLAMVTDQSDSAPSTESEPASDNGDGLFTAALIAAAVVAVLLLLAVLAIVVNNRRAKAA